jgi:hypothetical protein
MKKFLGVLVVGVLALGLTSTAYANYCSFDAVPAATLLFPFVAYDYEGGFEGQTTQLAITNVSSEAQIVHITVWTDYSVAILDFNLTLTGYDVARMNIRDILGFGLLPTEDAATGRNDNIWWDGVGTSNAGGTPFDDGPYSTHNELWNPAITINNLPPPESTNVLDCDPATWVASPINYVDPIPQGTLDIFEGYLTASQTATKAYRNCANTANVTFPAPTWFIARDGGPVWLYVTADVVAACNKDLPDSQATSYFSIDRLNTNGVIDNNVLIGDVIWMDAANRFSEADNAVHLESNPGGFLGAVPTFYFRYVDGINTADYREPLPTAWAFRYQLLADAGINTWVRAFKASSLTRTIADLGSTTTNFGNITTPGPAELYASACIPYTYYAWDEDENVNSFSSEEDPWSGGPESPIRPVPNLLPLETQEVDISQFFLVGQSDGDAFGWLLFVWPQSNGSAVDWYQTWMGVKYSGFGDYTAALSGAVMANYNCDQSQVLPGLGIGQFLP